MKNVFVCALLCCLCTFRATGQTEVKTQAPNVLATWLRNANTATFNNLRKSAEDFPEALYGMRPGPQKQVRTFGQIIGHLAGLNYLWCSQAKGEKNPFEGNDFEKLISKAAFVKALDGALSYCEPVYAQLTDASGLELVQITQEDGSRARVARMSLLILNYGHNNEHYGNLVTYMRIKSIVPPSSQVP